MKAYLFILSLFISISLQAELIDHEKVSKALQELRYSYQFPALSMAISCMHHASGHRARQSSGRGTLRDRCVELERAPAVHYSL